MTQVIAHRGASAAAPENTLDAFRLAVAMGADGIELDVRRTADGVLVVRHDAHLVDGTPLIEVTRADLPRDVPSLTDALGACEGAWVNVEIKNDPGEPDFDADRSIAVDTVETLLARNEDDRWVVSSFDLTTIDTVRAAAPSIATAWLVLDATDAVIDELRARGHRVLHPWVEGLRRDTVERLQAAGIRVNTWTCNDQHRLAELVAWGVDGICTDVPDRARRVVDGARIDGRGGPLSVAQSDSGSPGNTSRTASGT